MRDLSECKAEIRRRMAEKTKQKQVTRKRTVLALVLSGAAILVTGAVILSVATDRGDLPSSGRGAESGWQVLEGSSSPDGASIGGVSDGGGKASPAPDESPDSGESPAQQSREESPEPPKEDSHTGEPSEPPKEDSSDDEPTNLSQDESDPGCTSEPEYLVGRDDSPEDIRKTYEAFLASRGAGRRILSLEPLIGLLPITGFYEEGDAYSIGGLAVINDGVISGEDGLFRYHTSHIPGAEAEDVGVYDSYDRLSELGFPDPYKIYCRTYVKEGITVYALSVHPEPYAYINMYQLYFNIDGTWFRLASNGYTYPSIPGVLRGPDEWDQGFAYVTDATEELSDVENASSTLLRAIKSALAQ